MMMHRTAGVKTTHWQWSCLAGKPELYWVQLYYTPYKNSVVLCVDDLHVFVCFLDQCLRGSHKHVLQLARHVPSCLPGPHVWQQWRWRDGKIPVILTEAHPQQHSNAAIFNCHQPIIDYRGHRPTLLTVWETNLKTCTLVIINQIIHNLVDDH